MNYACRFVSTGDLYDLFCQNCSSALLWAHIMLRDELTQKFSHFNKITVFGYPRACRFRKYQFENRSIMGAPSTNFFQNVIFTS
jgi:hypothetical protein